MPVRSSQTSTDTEEPFAWFDETYASSIKPVAEAAPPATFESLMQDVDDRAEHSELLASFGRVRRPAATARIALDDEQADS